MAFFRTSTMAGVGKKSKSKSMERNSMLNPGKGATLSGSGGRRHTMLPSQRQPAATRDSVLSNGSSDRSSSLSDEMVLLSPPLTDQGCFQLSLEVEEQIREVWPLKCFFVVKEIMQTEMAYVHSLADIIKGYLTPLYSYLLSSGESPNFVKTVFSNIVKIHKIHEGLMEAFQESCASPMDFGTTFLRVDFLSVYAVYCTSYSQGNECLEKSLGENDYLRDFIEQCQREIGHSLPLSSQLIKPVQRILKYRLLLEELSKNFDPQHSAYSTVQAALEKMSSVAEQINTSFSNQAKSSSKGVPSAVAKRRINQIGALQKSRSAKSRHRGDSPPSSSSSMGPRSSSETHLNHPPPSSHTLPNGVSLWATPLNHNSAAHALPPRSISEDSRGLADSLPKVQHLKSFFEKLNKEGEDAKRHQTGGMKKASSMAGTKRDSISTVGLMSSPTKSPSWSPLRSPPKSPIKVPVLPQSPKKPYFPPVSPTKETNTKETKFSTPISPALSPARRRRRSSVGSVADLRVSIARGAAAAAGSSGGGGGGDGKPRRGSDSAGGRRGSGSNVTWKDRGGGGEGGTTRGRLVEREQGSAIIKKEIPSSSQVTSTVPATDRPAAVAMAANRISEEIRRHIEMSKRAAIPRTIV